MSSLMVGHFAPLPAPQASAQTATPALERARAAGADLAVVHFLYADCRCSGRVAEHLMRSDRPVGASENVVLVGDDDRLARALENLLRNALQHARSAVHVQAVRVGDAVQFTVSDDGPGLPAEPDGTVDLARLALTPSRPDSSGIGLLVVRRVAALHGGSIGG
ncbi:MAG: ATP-binding protein, partial [Planctomycetota bacterium]